MNAQEQLQLLMDEREIIRLVNRSGDQSARCCGFRKAVDRGCSLGNIEADLHQGRRPGKDRRHAAVPLKPNLSWNEALLQQVSPSDDFKTPGTAFSARQPPWLHRQQYRMPNSLRISRPWLLPTARES